MSEAEKGSGIPAPPQTFLYLLHKFAKVKVHFDADAPDVIAPDWLKGATCFEYGLNLSIPIVDLFVSMNGIRATLSFNQSPYKTFVPWGAVAMFTVDDPTGDFKQCGAGFEADVYDEANGAVKSGTKLACVLPPHGEEVNHLCMPVGEVANKAPGLRAVGAEETPPEDLAPAPTVPGRPTLTVVK